MNFFSNEEKIKLYNNCYITNNNFAYKFDTNDNHDNELKVFNFVPTYDNWCLGCSNKNAQFRCSKCKSVYFCNKECQKKCWKIHKKHCQRNLFEVCSFCCSKSPKLKCEKCPVKFCDETCKSKIFSEHKDFDCDYFHKTFGEKYLDYD